MRTNIATHQMNSKLTKSKSLRPGIKRYFRNVAGGAKIVGGAVKRAASKIF